MSIPFKSTHIAVSLYIADSNLLNRGYFQSTPFVKEAIKAGKKGEEITFYDSNTGKTPAAPRSSILSVIALTFLSYL